MIELIVAKSAQELKDKFEEFKSNSFIEPLPYPLSYSGGKEKIIDKTDTVTNGTDFIMTVNYWWRKIPSRH